MYALLLLKSPFFFTDSVYIYIYIYIIFTGIGGAIVTKILILNKENKHLFLSGSRLKLSQTRNLLEICKVKVQHKSCLSHGHCEYLWWYIDICKSRCFFASSCVMRCMYMVWSVPACLLFLSSFWLQAISLTPDLGPDEEAEVT